MMQLIPEKLADGIGCGLGVVYPLAGWLQVCGDEGYYVGMAISTRISENDGRAPQGLLYMPAGEHVISATFNGQAATRRVLVNEAAAERLQADLAAVWQEVEAGKRARPCVYFNHESGPAAMVPRRFSWVPGKGVVLEGEWTAAGRAAVEGGDFAYFSPCFRRDRESGEVMGLTAGVEVGSLVNDPAFEENECIAAARNVPRVEDVMAANFSGCNQYGHGFAGECSGGGGLVREFEGMGPKETKARCDEEMKKVASAITKRRNFIKRVYNAAYTKVHGRDGSIEVTDEDRKALADAEKEKERLTDEANKALKERRRVFRAALKAGGRTKEEIEQYLSGWPETVKAERADDEQVDALCNLPPREEVALAGHCGDNEGTAGGGGNSIMDEAKLKMLLGLPADADSAAVEAALAKCAGAGKKLEKVEAELADLKKKEHEHKEKAAKAFSDGLLKKGVIAPKEEDKIKAARNLYMQSPADAEAVFGSIAAPKEEAAVAGKVHPEADGAARADVSVMDHLMAEFKA